MIKAAATERTYTARGRGRFCIINIYVVWSARCGIAAAARAVLAASARAVLAASARLWCSCFCTCCAGISVASPHCAHHGFVRAVFPTACTSVPVLPSAWRASAGVPSHLPNSWTCSSSRSAEQGSEHSTRSSSHAPSGCYVHHVRARRSAISASAHVALWRVSGGPCRSAVAKLVRVPVTAVAVRTHRRAWPDCCCGAGRGCGSDGESSTADASEDRVRQHHAFR